MFAGDVEEMGIRPGAVRRQKEKNKKQVPTFATSAAEKTTAAATTKRGAASLMSRATKARASTRKGTRRVAT